MSQKLNPSKDALHEGASGIRLFLQMKLFIRTEIRAHGAFRLSSTTFKVKHFYFYHRDIALGELTKRRKAVMNRDTFNELPSNSGKLSHTNPASPFHFEQPLKTGPGRFIRHLENRSVSFHRAPILCSFSTYQANRVF